MNPDAAAARAAARFGRERAAGENRSVVAYS